MIQVTALPFVEHFVLVREYDQSCLLYLHGEPMKLVGTGYECLRPKRWAGGRNASEFEAVPVVLVARKGNNILDTQR
jgi:hypothetical protein